MIKPKENDQHVKAVEYSHTLEKLLIMERENSAAIRSELEAAERERDELKENETIALQLIARMERQVLGYQAELARRDAAAGKPYGYVHKSLYEAGGYAGLSNDHEAYRDSLTHIPLYTAAQPAVLPPEIDDIWDAIHMPCMATSNLDERECCVARDAYNQCRADALALGAQQQNVVEFPEPVKWPEVPYRYFSEDQVFSMLNAANVKWEVKP